MTNDTRIEGSTWPMPQFHFSVDLSPELKGVTFQEVSGLNKVDQIADDQHSNSQLFSTYKIPGLTKFSAVTMKRGIFLKDINFWKWTDEIMLNTVKRYTMLIKLLDESGGVTQQWQLNNAWPTKITGVDLKADGNQVAVDSLEVACEQLIISPVK